MPSEIAPEAGPPTTDEFDREPRAANALPVLPTILFAYRFIGEHLVAFIAVAAVVGVIQVSILSQTSWALDSVSPEIALSLSGIAALLFASIVYAFAGVRWCRGIVLGHNRRSRPQFNPRVLQFAIGMFLFLMLLNELAMFSRPDANELASGIDRWVERRLSLTGHYFWPIALSLIRVLVASLVFLSLAAIATDASRPVGRGATMALRNLASVYVVFFLGLAPWMLLQGVALIPLLAVAIVGLEALATYQSVWILVAILNAWITTTSIALGASAYRTLSQADSRAEAADVFD